MRWFLFFVLLLVVHCVQAQEVTYSISYGSGSGGAFSAPKSIDTARFYSYSEMKNMATPVDGWEVFYTKVKELDYPEDAKKKKLQTSFTVACRVDEAGAVDSVYIKYRQDCCGLQECASCEQLIIDAYKNAKWTPGNYEGTPVKTVHYHDLVFRIHDPNVEDISPFGF